MTYGTPSDWSDERIARLKELAAEGWSTGQIAKEMNATRSAVSGKAMRLGVKFKGAGANQYRDHAGRRRPVVLTNPNGPAASRPRPKPPAPPPEHAAVHDVVDLKFHHCRWPIGDPAEEGFGFCGAPRDENSVYCPGHKAKGTVPTKSRVRPPYEYTVQRVRAA